MAIYGIIESLVPIVFGPLYSVIYSYTVNTLPGAYSLVGSVLAVPATIIYLWVLYYLNRAVKKKSGHGGSDPRPPFASYFT